jgi:hypothetical protein
MKAIFVGGEMHGTSKEIHAAMPRIEILDKISELSFSADGIFVGVDPGRSAYELEIILQDFFAVYRYDEAPTTWESFNRLYLLNLGSGVIGINRWLDEQFECRLAYDADLRRRLFAARVSFDFAIQKIESDQTEARLKRRFPETFTK